MLKKTFFITIVYLLLLINTIAENKISISVIVDDEIITNHDIKKEAIYLKALNPNLNQLDNKKILQIAKESLINEIIKKIEIKKVFNLDEDSPLVNEYLKDIYSKLNFNNEIEFKNYISNTTNYKIDDIKKKIKIEIKWNELIYLRYSKQVNIDRDGILKKINNLGNEFTKEYQLSEIVFKKEKNKNLNDLLKNINSSITEIGFNNTANIYSISDSNKLGGKIGWIEENNLSETILIELKKLSEGEVSNPIKIGNNFLILKIEKIKEKNVLINKEEEFKKMINFQTNKQLNQFSKIFFDKSKINYTINEK